MNEDIDTYIWIIRGMESMENRWNVSQLKIMYADGLIKDRLLTELGIEESCILHGDFFHLFKENWPKQTNFGSKRFNLVKEYLQSMLLSKTRMEWDTAFQYAAAKLQQYPRKLELLKEIYNNPRYYSGFYTKDIVGNLNLYGTAPAEQNHSSITAHLGKGASWDIWEQLKNLCERHQFHCDKEAKHEAKLTVISHKYRSTFDSPYADEDVLAKQTLSAYAYEKWKTALKFSFRLQSELQEDGITYNIWPASEVFDKEKHHSLIVGDRCSCRHRRDFDIQCGHELKVNPKFQIDKWSDRWLQRREFNVRNPDLMCFPTSSQHGIEFMHSLTTGSNRDRQIVHSVSMVDKPDSIQESSLKTTGLNNENIDSHKLIDL